MKNTVNVIQRQEIFLQKDNNEDLLMANKTIVIGKNDSNDAASENAANNEVYKDVSMLSEHKFHNNISLSDKKI